MTADNNLGRGERPSGAGVLTPPDAPWVKRSQAHPEHALCWTRPRDLFRFISVEELQAIEDRLRRVWSDISSGTGQNNG